MQKKIIVGLGNPGREYIRTRHNLGFWVVDLLALKLDAAWGAVRYKASIAETDYASWHLILAKPVTYMNLSGESVSRLLRYREVKPADLIVICDDINLPLGKIRIRKKGGAGGHHGLESIIDWVGGDDFPRFRIGAAPLDRPLPDDLSQIVLERFGKGEEALASESARKGVDAVLDALESDLDSAMNRFNG